MRNYTRISYEGKKRKVESGHVYLAPREREVLWLVAKGLRAREIAEKLGIARRTVYFYYKCLHEKFGVSSLAGLIREAIFFSQKVQMEDDDETRPEYDFSGGVRGKYATKLNEGEKLYRVTMRNLCAGAVVNASGIIIETAPILEKFKGQPIENLRNWVRQNGGTVKCG